MAQQTGARVVPILAARNRHHTPPIGSPWLLFSDFIEVFGAKLAQNLLKIPQKVNIFTFKMIRKTNP